MAAMSDWTARFINLTHEGSFYELSKISFNVFGSSIILGITMWELPEWAATTLAGTINVNLHDRMVATSKFASGVK